MVFIHVNETKSKEPLFDKTKYNDAKTGTYVGALTCTPFTFTSNAQNGSQTTVLLINYKPALCNIS